MWACLVIKLAYYNFVMAGTVGKAALLLRDAQGDRRGSLLPAFIRKKKDVAVLRGSLLIALPPKDSTSGADGKPAHNYGVHHEDITLYCEYDDIAPLTNYEFQLLSGISTLGARYDAFISDNHEWGSKLREGEIVYVALPTKEAIANTGCQAVVRWIGTLPGETGIKFGIEITVRLITPYDYIIVKCISFLRMRSIEGQGPPMASSKIVNFSFVVTIVGCLYPWRGWLPHSTSVQQEHRLLNP